MEFGLGIFIVSAACSGLLTWPVRELLRRAGVIDRPGPRSSHSVPTVRGGGAVIVLIVTGIFIWVNRANPGACAALALPSAALAAVSFRDDIASIAVGIRLVVHLAAAAAAVAWLIFLDPASPAETTGAGLWIYGATVLGVAGYTNAFNFMDGINGLACFQALVTGLGTAAIICRAGLPWNHPAVGIALALAGAAAGFLPYNFPRASVFLGDVGSAAMGFWLALAAVWAGRDGGWALLWPLGCLHANFLIDTGVTLARRAARGGAFYRAHREHFYQKLVQAGWSHARVSLCEFALQSFAAILLAGAVRSGCAEMAAACAVVLLMWIALFSWAEFIWRRAAPRPSRPGGNV